MEDILEALKSFYHSYIVETVNGTFQIFQSFTYGEIAISFLLVVLIVLYLLKWFWEILR